MIPALGWRGDFFFLAALGVILLILIWFFTADRPAAMCPSGCCMSVGQTYIRSEYQVFVMLWAFTMFLACGVNALKILSADRCLVDTGEKSPRLDIQALVSL
jgi:predicted MFS family arabinose efflux permease